VDGSLTQSPRYGLNVDPPVMAFNEKLSHLPGRSRLQASQNWLFSPLPPNPGKVAKLGTSQSPPKTRAVRLPGPDQSRETVLFDLALSEDLLAFFHEPA
jgi:hypothetical protein